MFDQIGEKVDVGGVKGQVKSVCFLYAKLNDEAGSEMVMPNNLILSRVITTFSDSENK